MNNHPAETSVVQIAVAAVLGAALYIGMATVLLRMARFDPFDPDA